MRCQHCGSECRAGAKFCGKCGATIAPPTSPLDGLLDGLGNIEKQLSGQLDEAVASLDRELAGLGSPPKEASHTLAPTGAKPLLHPLEVSGLLIPQAEQISQSASFVFSSPFIARNAQYADVVRRIRFAILLDDPEVNAFATSRPCTLPDGRTVEPPVIAFLGGLATALRLGSAALAVEIRGERGRKSEAAGLSLKDTFQRMGKGVTQSGGNLEVDAAIDIFGECLRPAIPPGEERFVSLARDYAAAMDMFVVAHEAGHIALGHTHGQAANFDVSRNQEREADSFAASVLSSCPFRGNLFLGQVFVTIVFTWVEHAARVRGATTHPVARDRFACAFESNSQAAREAAEEFGLTRQKLMELMPADAAV